MAWLNGVLYSGGQLLDFLGLFPNALEAMAFRGVPFSVGSFPHSEPFSRCIKEDGRMHLTWSENRLGRLYSRPIVPKEDRNLQNGFRSVVLKSMELVVAACLADDEAMVDAYLSGKNLHQYRADLLGISVKEAQNIHYYAFSGGGEPQVNWPEARQSCQLVRQQINQTGMVRTPLFRRALTQDRNQTSSAFLNKAWGNLVMSTAADLVKMALVLAHQSGIRVYGVFIDEFLVESSQSELMENILTDQLPIRFLVQRTSKSALSRICGEDDVI